jgi:predicted nucleotidyltransferase
MVFGEEFADLVGVEVVEIFGSWAARYQGEPGPPPGDIDVLVVGPVDRDEVFSAAQRAERRLVPEVNAMVISADRWNARTDPIVREILARPRIPIIPTTEAEATTNELGTGTPRHPETPRPGPLDAGDR